MSRPHEEQIKAAVMQFFTVLLLSMGLSLTALKALLPLQALWPAALLCVLISLVFEGLYLLPLRKKWIFPLGLAVGLGIWALFGGGPVHTAIQLVKAAFLTLRGIPDAAVPYADAARWAVCLVFTLLAAALAWDDTLPLAFFAVTTILALIFIFSAQANLLLYALPAAAGLLLMLARSQEKRVSPLPLVALLVIAAFFLMPSKPAALPQLAKISSDIRQFVEDYLLFNEVRASFSLASEGFQPLEDRLGGPARPEKHTVMEVTTDRTLLLKGKAYNEYTGLNWIDTLSARRYLYASPRFTALKEELFDLNRPLLSPLAAPETARVHLLSNGTTTLFTPAHTRTLQMESERMVLYYNLASELFITRNLETSDSYTLTYLPYIAGSQMTAQAVAACAAMEDPHYAEAAENYLKVPRHIQQEIYDIAARAAGNAATPYEQAMNIMRYLRSHYRYRLDVQVPPAGVDFVAWFLIGEREGYCTYFATAMTVLCRIMGIPARYVTGYVAAPDESGVAVVTGEEAHAWTEIYLNGFGWLAIDATPRSQDDDPNGNDGENQEHDGDTPPSPTPTPEPTQEPTPDPDTAPSDAPTQEPDGADAPPPTPTPPPEGTDGAATPTPPPFAQEENEKDLPFRWWLLLLLLILVTLIARYLLTEPLRQATRHPQQAAEILFAAIAALLSKRGIRKMPQETLHEFAARADNALSGQQLPSMGALADQLAGQLYGHHPADAAPFRSAYTALRSDAKPWVRAELALKRMVTFQR
ncbi:MAG: DUF4129 domain-containing protein [Clostridia bacterium]|nr:DUF4129 domain-containing protein [Clostridia bacterium]